MAQEEVKFPAPAEEEMTKLKATHGKIYRVAFDLDTVFYIRRVKRGEYKRIIEVVSKADAAVREDILNEKLLETAMVWSSVKVDPAFYSDSGAGIIPTLAMQIMDRSGFTNQIDVAEV
jgi:deoxyribose-phosphate aldolase